MTPPPVPSRLPLRRSRAAIALWLVGLALCCAVIARTTFTADLSAFLPQSPTPEQQVLLDQLRDGMVSRLILVGLEGGNAPSRAAVSRAMASRLRTDPLLTNVSNGEPVNAERDQAFLFGNRFLLSPAVAPRRFSTEGLHEALAGTIELLASPAGMAIKQLLPRDPTGETVLLLEQIAGGNRPKMRDGVWISRDGERALLLVQTRAAGADTDGQQQAMQRVRQAFDAASSEILRGKQVTQGTQGTESGQGAAIGLIMTGPGVFSVQSRNTIEHEVTRLSIISTVIIVALLLAVYRSLAALALGLLPVLSGALAGVVAVSLGFGMVHGITLGFGTTLIGEAVDYSIYLFVQSRQPGGDAQSAERDWVATFWPTIRLGVLTSIAGFSSLLLSTFPGLAQLGLYSIAGLIAAAAVTRFVLPHLLPAGFRIRDISALGRAVAAFAGRAPLLRWPAAAVIAAACILVYQHRDGLWNTELSSLSPVAKADQDADARLRADMGAPDVRYMVALSGNDREAALVSAEKVGQQLDALVSKGILAGYESPSRYLPSVAAQRARQASLPAEGLAQRMAAAVDGLPVQPQLFAPFIADVAAAKVRQPLLRADLDGTSFALAVDSLMFERGGRWHALLPLTAPSAPSAPSAAAAGASAGAAGIAPALVRAALAAAGQPDAVFVDLKAESDNLYSGYLRQAILLSLGGLAAIVLLLAVSLRSPARIGRVLLPLVAAVVTVIALLAVSGHRMTILHLVGLLLIVAVGSNYALFFSGGKDHASRSGISPQTLASLAVANLTTVAGFGLLAFSTVPVLQAIGITVGPGAMLALFYSAVFADAAAVRGAAQGRLQ